MYPRIGKKVLYFSVNVLYLLIVRQKQTLMFKLNNLAELYDW